AAALAGADVCRHRRRGGKAEALRTGVAAARARGATHVVTLDADGQHDSDDVPALLAAAAPRTLVVGARLYGDAALPPGRAEAIVVAGFFVNWASGLRLIDTQSGFRVYPLEIFDEVSAHHGGFVFETEVLLAAAGHGWTIREVPVRALPRVAARSRFRPVVDGIAIGARFAGLSLARGPRAAAGADGPDRRPLRPGASAGSQPDRRAPEPCEGAPTAITNDAVLMDAFDVIVAGGGPGGSSTATFLADAGLRVALFERERFPRFHVGESLMPASMLLLEQLGVRAAMDERGFQLKY